MYKINSAKDKAKKLLLDWKENRYIFGRGVLPRIGELAAPFGRKALVVCNGGAIQGAAEKLCAALEDAGLSLASGAIVPGARPNAPHADVYRIETYILHHQPDLIIAVGGGSTIDACKASNFLAGLGGEVSAELDHWFGTGIVSGALAKTGKKLRPLIAVQSAASSASHLTKYANVTDPAAGQKKLVVDEAVVPCAALFDYDLSASMPPAVTVDGILDTLAHCFEVFSGIPAEKYDLAAVIMETALQLILGSAPALIKNPYDMEAREALGMAADLGGYAIMTGGTNAAHLNSFSFVDLTGHGTACGIMNPYYAVFFSPVIEKQLRLIGGIFKQYGYSDSNFETLSGRELGLAAAVAMIRFSGSIGAPVALQELPRFNEGSIAKALEAAKDPQLEMKLKNMPLPLSADGVDQYMEPVLRAAACGDFSLIKCP